MKKFITLALAFVMVLSLTVPALAFTTKELDEEVDVPYILTIKLVEVDEDDFGTLFTLPPSDRGYAKNEVVTAVVTLLSPNKANLIKDGYQKLVLSGDNVRINYRASDVLDNFTHTSLVSTGSQLATNAGLSIFPVGSWGNDKITIDFYGVNAAGTVFNEELFDNTAKFTYACAFSAKVLDDEATMNAKLTKAVEFDANDMLCLGDYDVIKTVGSSTDIYTVLKHANPIGSNFSFASVDNLGTGSDYLFEVHTNSSNGRSVSMSVWYNGFRYAIYVDREDEIAFDARDNLGGILIDGTTTPMQYVTNIEMNSNVAAVRTLYRQVRAIYDEYVVDAFGFDFFLRGNKVDDSTFESVANADDVFVEVAIEPWYAYVEVPPAIQVDPPKTGDAMSIVGFIMIALAGLAVVAVKKVRA